VRRARAGRVAALVATILPMTGPAAAQQATSTSRLCAPDAIVVDGLQDHGTDFMRVVELGGAAPLGSWMLQRPAALRATAVHCASPTASPWSARFRDAAIAAPARAASLPFFNTVEYNSGYPRSRNNGALWAGRGMNAGVGGGVHFEIGPFSATLAPVSRCICAAWTLSCLIAIASGERKLVACGKQRKFLPPRKYASHSFNF
jgi:hypothetical protein